MTIAASDRQALESFITSSELLSLETRFARFNLFEALGVERRELNHSSFLAFILDPNGSHGLGQLFLQRFLQEVVKRAESPAISAFDLDGMDLSCTEVTREFENIDVLLYDSKNAITVIIENKVDSKQHSNQLERYAKIAERKFPATRRIYVYLTPGGDDPENIQYIAFSYANIRELIREILLRESVLISSPIRMTLEQYIDLLGRRFMADAELTKLCAQIYKRHKQAIDIIVDNIPDEREEIAALAQQLIDEAGFIKEDSTTSYVRFLPAQMDLPYLSGAKGWTKSGRLVLFEFRLQHDSVTLALQMGAGPTDRREVIHSFALQHPPLTPEKTLYTKWQRLYTKILLSSNDYELDRDSQEILIKKRWAEFLSLDLPLIVKAFSGNNWPTP